MADENTRETEGTTGTPETEGTTQTAPAGQSGTQERTYTQAEVDELLGGYVEQSEVNRLVGEARRKTRSKFEGYDEYKAAAEAHADYDEVASARDKALSDVERLTAQIEHMRLVEKVHVATGVPSALLKGDTEEELTASAEAVKAYAGSQAPNPPEYPEDKGGAATPSKMTREQILAEPDTQKRQRLIAENISLFE
jgi:hypothetical protein